MMRLSILSSTILVAVTVSAFSPAHNVATTGRIQFRPSSTSTSASMAARASPGGGVVGGLISNPLAKLPWNVERQRKREERRLKQEASLLYRELGVAEDATFEEIQEATATLLARYEGDLKRTVKVEICKDKIMQIRLNQRLGGLTKVSSDAAANDYLEEEAEEFSNQPSSWELPKWMQGLIVKPDAVWRDQCVAWYGSLAALGVLIPPQTEFFTNLSLLLSGAFIGNRGLPKGDPSQGYFARGKVGPYTFLAFGIALTAYIVFGFITSLIIKALPFLEGSTFLLPFKNILMCGFMGLTTAYVKTYKGT